MARENADCSEFMPVPSAEKTVQKPVARQTLAIQPEHAAAIVGGDVVIALDAVAVPPAGFDPLGPADHLQRPPVKRPLVAQYQLERHFQYPRGPRLRGHREI